MNNILKISAVVILLVAIIYIVVATFFTSGGSTNTKFDGFGEMVTPSRSVNTKSSDDLEVNIDKILINMHSGAFKYMKADMAFRMKDDNSKDKLKKIMPHVRDTILRFSSNQDSDRLATPEGKEQYKKNLKDLLYESYGLEVQNIYFRDFVLAK